MLGFLNGINLNNQGSFNTIPTTTGPQGLHHVTFTSLDADPLLNFQYEVIFDHSFFPVSRLYANDVKVEGITIEGNQQYTAGQFTKYAGKVTNGDLTISFYEDRKLTVGNNLQKWAQKVYNRSTRTYGLPANYKTNITINILDHNNIYGTYRALGVWPEVILPPYSFDIEDSKVITIECKFFCDDFEYIMA